VPKENPNCEIIVLERAVSSILAASAAIPEASALSFEISCVESASARGYFLPDEEEYVRLRYSQYLSLRSALLTTLGEIATAAGRNSTDWSGRLPVFATAFTAACLLMRANRFVIQLAADRPVIWKKLDEADQRAGIPRKSFTAIYQSSTSAYNLRRFLAASDFHNANRTGILNLASHPVVSPLIPILIAEEPGIERRRSDALKRLFAYRWFSFLRRHRSAWRQVMFGFFKASGRAIAELRQPGIKKPGTPKRINPDLRNTALARAKPGDVFVTRHDDALSNLFLPGFWPHAALFLGSRSDCQHRGIQLPENSDDGPWFLEAKKDGVRFRPASETLAVDAFVMLRPPFSPEEMNAALTRAASHEGKPYDFLFDFRTSDYLACTEVIYRGMHGIGPVKYHLEEVGGRLCLPAEELLNQSMDCGFRVVATAGLRGNRLRTGIDAETAFHSSRQPL
jgi:hypothetical protein